MENRRNYYRILHVQPGAPVEIIRASYRTLMQRLRAHPDLGGDHWNAALINEAYAVLTDAGRRAEYDRELQARLRDARGDGEPQDGASAAPAAQSAQAAGTEPAGDCLFCGATNPSRPNLNDDAACCRCGSPLRRATLGLLGADGRRSVLRLAKDLPLRLYASWPQAQPLAARSRDISPHGISFVTRELLQPRAVLKLDCDTCRAVVQVANLRLDPTEGDDAWLVGAAFLSVSFNRGRGAFLATEA